MFVNVLRVNGTLKSFRAFARVNVLFDFKLLFCFDRYYVVFVFVLFLSDLNNFFIVIFFFVGFMNVLNVLRVSFRFVVSYRVFVSSRV